MTDAAAGCCAAGVVAAAAAAVSADAVAEGARLADGSPSRLSAPRRFVGPGLLSSILDARGRRGELGEGPMDCARRRPGLRSEGNLCSGKPDSAAKFVEFSGGGGGRCAAADCENSAAVGCFDDSPRSFVSVPAGGGSPPKAPGAFIERTNALGSEVAHFDGCAAMSASPAHSMETS